MTALAASSVHTPIDLHAVMELRLGCERIVIRYRDRDRRKQTYVDLPQAGELYAQILRDHQPDSTIATADFGLAWAGRRWRGHLYHHIGGWSAALRLFPESVGSLVELDFEPENILSLARGEGLALFAGPTGAGKSTTLASVMRALGQADLLGDTVTIEQPIEYVHASDEIEQRQVGDDTASFAGGVIEAMRQTPRTIVIGEIRDPATADAAIQAGLTGHRVLATLHAKNLHDAIVRMLALLPEHQRSLLATALQGIMVQALVRVPHSDAMPIYETLLINDAVSSIIEKGIDSLSLLNHEFRHQGRASMSDMRQRLVRDGIIPA